MRESVSVKDFGAVGDGVTDDVGYINSAINSVSLAGGGTVFLPPGEYLVGRSVGASAIVLKSNVYLIGAGINATIIKNINNAHVIDMHGVVNCGISNITVDGNRDNTTSGVHCIRSGGVEGLTLENLEIKNAKSYGIGLEVGSQIRVWARNIYIHDTGADGLDIKDPNLNNYDIVFDTIKVDNAGMDAAALGGLSQAGLSLRGTGKFSNIFVSNVTANNVGIRADQSTPSILDTRGGRRSSFTNFDIRAADVSTTSFGLELRADSCTVSNGYISGCHRGVNIQDSDISISGVVVEESKDAAFYIASGTGGIDPGNVSFSQCTAKWADIAGTAYGFKIAADIATGTRITSCRVRNATTAVLLGPLANYTTISDCDFRGNTYAINNSGTDTVIDNVLGFKTAGKYISSDLACDSLGTKSFTITHGLAETPEIQDIIPYLMKGSATTDFRVGYLSITAANSTTFSGSLYISTASATPGAVVNVGCTATIYK